MFSKDIKLIFHDRKNLLLLLILILLAVAAVRYGSEKTASSTVRMGVADQDDSEYSRLLLSYFEENEVFSSYISIVRGDESGLEEAFAEGELDLYLVIPANFTENLINIDNTPIKAVINSDNISKAVLYKNLLEAYAEYISKAEVNCQAVYEIMQTEGYDMSLVRSVNYDISYDLIFTALGKDDFFSRQTDQRIRSIPLVDYYIYSVFFLLIMYIGMFAGMSYLKEKTNQMLLRLKSTGRSSAAAIFSKVFAFGTVYGLAALAAMLLANRYSKLQFEFKSIVFIIFTVFAACLLFTVIAAFMPSLSSFAFAANMLILLLMICGGGIIPIMYMPEAMAKIAGFTPNYWFIRLLI